MAELTAISLIESAESHKLWEFEMVNKMATLDFATNPGVPPMLRLCRTYWLHILYENSKAGYHVNRKILNTGNILLSNSPDVCVVYTMETEN